MSEPGERQARTVGALLDRLGVTVALADGDMITNVILVAKIADADGGTIVTVASDPGTGWYDEGALLHYAGMHVDMHAAAERDDD